MRPTTELICSDHGIIAASKGSSKLWYMRIPDGRTMRMVRYEQRSRKVDGRLSYTHQTAPHHAPRYLKEVQQMCIQPEVAHTSSYRHRFQY